MIPELTSSRRRALRAAAHSLNPVVAIAQHGLSPTVLAEIDRSLNAHELIKVRVYGEDRDVRETLMNELCEALSAAPVQHIGNILVIWRQKPIEEPAPAKPVRTSGRARKAEKVEGKLGSAPAKPRVSAAKPRVSRSPAPSPRRRATTTKGRGGR